MTTRQSKPLEAGELLQHTAFVTAMARGVLGRDPLADDAVQETWLAALRGAGPRKPGALRSWLGSISRRRAQDLRRKQAVHDRLEGQAAQPGAEPSTAELAARAELGRTMVAAVLALDEPYREVLLLRYYEDLPPRAIASRLGLPVETVRTRTRRGLERLRAGLTRSRGGDGKAWSAVLVRWMGAGSAGPATAGVGV
ncbi:MAG: sigma-70 family RNA polymerase sigma factor, partial [bacterium]|nr:sigma-70 family RNA polymerase sigma factor [bacterium]